ncbi:MAG: cytochrome c-type biogenesis protein CcmH [Acidimicrobiaceae bacterium]|nr:cytochrome c-type biogenesis protein CcmH [Acidimicrobiaceae bacterium]
MSARAFSWLAALLVAAAAFIYGAVDDGPPRTNADRVRELSEDFACPVCAGQSIAESDVPVAREIRRQIAVWVDEGRSDSFIRDQLVAAYDADIDYNPSGSGITSLVWILPVLAGAAITAVLVVTLRSGRVPSSRPISSGAAPEALSDAAPGMSSEASSERLGPDEPRHSQATQPGRRRLRNAAAWIVVVLVTAGAAGLLVARFSGSRGADSSISGEVRATVRELVFEAQRLLNEGDISAAIAAYDEALEQQPSHVEALTYRGWLTSRQGDSAAAAEFLDDAIAGDPGYPDARLFRAIVALEQGDGSAAAAQLEAFDSLDPPPFAEDLLARSQVRERIAQARGAAALEALEALPDDPPPFAATSLGVADMLAAAEVLAARGDLLAALQLLDWVLQSIPGDAEVLAGWGWLLVRSSDPELVELGTGYLDAAVDADPRNPAALLYRSFTRWQKGDSEGARADLEAFDGLESRPPELVALAERQGLRAALRG